MTDSRLQADPQTDPESADDATLIERCRRGDASGWTVLVRRYQRLVYTVVRRIGLDDHDAADVFQTVFSRLLKHLAGLKEPEHLQAWIVTTAKREALLQRTRSRRHVSMTGSAEGVDDDSHDGREWDIADDTPRAEQALAELQQHELVRRALDRLDLRCRDLLTLLFLDDDDKIAYDDVAARLGMPVGSIGPTRSRCLAKLRQLVI